MRPASAYRVSHVGSAPQTVVVAMLYAEAIKRVERADPASGRAFTDDLGHARAIIVELRAALDATASAEMTSRLAALYDFLFHQLVEAGRERSRDRLGTVAGVLRKLAEGWAAVREPAAVA
jgi:flagellar biosynthetic protein FliS